MRLFDRRATRDDEPDGLFEPTLDHRAQPRSTMRALDETTRASTWPRCDAALAAPWGSRRASGAG
jgi:hypothetical protein